MKRITILTTLILSIFLYNSCKKDEPGNLPEIELSQESVLISDQGTSVTIQYRISGKNGEDKISAAWNEQWLTVNTQNSQEITFMATVNSDYSERSSDVTFSYPGAESVILTVTQSGKEKPLRLEITGISATEVTFSGYTTDPQMTWIPMIANGEYFEYVTDDEQLFLEDMEYFTYFADLQDLSIEDFLTQMLETGTTENRVIDGLDPSTDYVLYGYGLTPKGVPTTEVVKIPFTTEPPYEGDLTFEFELSVSDFILNYEITPSHSGVPFYYGIIDKETLNGWFETYQTEDLTEAIQQGDIESTIDLLLEYALISSRGSYFEIFNNTSKVEDGYYECHASTEYIIYAAKWDENCNLIGEVSFAEFETEELNGTDLKIDIEILDITQSNLVVRATPSNNEDSYVIIPETSASLDGMDDSQIFEYIMKHYDSFLSEYTYTGVKERKFSRLSSNTDYTLLAFGYKAGSLTTSEIYKTPFTTLESGAPEECTFDIIVEAESDMANVKITPSDKGYYYHWMAYTSDYSAEQAKDYLRNIIINEYYEGNYPAFASWELAIGDIESEIWDLWPETEYKIGVIIMDYNTGEFLSEMAFSEPFTTEAANYADISITAEFGPYFDLQELIDAGYSEFEDAAEESGAIMPVEIVIEGEYSEFYYDIYKRDLTDEETYPDEAFYQDLYYGKTFESSSFLLPYDTQMTLIAVALDKQYNYSKLFRKTFILTQDGASDVSEYVRAAANSLMIGEQRAKTSNTKKETYLSEEEIADKEIAAISASITPKQRESLRYKECKEKLENRKHLTKVL